MPKQVKRGQKYTKSVKGGSRSSGGGKQETGRVPFFNCGVLVIYLPAAAGIITAALVARETLGV